MRILVIGGAGFIGTVLCRRLLAAGNEVTILDRQASPLTHPALKKVVADVRDADGIAPHFAGVDVVFNLAAEHRDDVRPVSRYDEVNVEGAAHICRAAEAHGIKRIVFTSSVAVYGTAREPLTESSPHNFINDYGRTKHLAEAVHERWLDAAPDRELVIVRPTVVFGPGNRGNVYNLLRQIKSGRFVMIGRGANVKSLAHVENIAAFLEYVLHIRNRKTVLNYADKPDFSMAELVRFTDGVLGRAGGRRLRLPYPAGIAAGVLADVAARLLGRSLPISAVRIRKFCSDSIVDSGAAFATGFSPQASLAEGLRDMIVKHV
jgi:nucleoside-diphosphate-sugar epimerase